MGLAKGRDSDVQEDDKTSAPETSLPERKTNIVQEMVIRPFAVNFFR